MIDWPLLDHRVESPMSSNLFGSTSSSSSLWFDPSSSSSSESPSSSDSLSSFIYLSFLISVLLLILPLVFYLNRFPINPDTPAPMALAAVTTPFYLLALFNPAMPILGTIIDWDLCDWKNFSTSCSFLSIIFIIYSYASFNSAICLLW